MTQLKRLAFRAAVYILLVVSVPASILFLGYLYLPVYVESAYIPKLFEKTGISPLECRIRRIGFTGLDAGPIQFGDENSTALLIRTLQIDYALTELVQKRIKNVRLTGVTLHCAFENGVLTLPGLDLTPLLAMAGQTPGDPGQTPGDPGQTPGDPGSTPGHSGQPRGTNPLKMMPARIELRSGTLILAFKQRFYRIPFELVVKKEDDGLVRGMVWIYPRGQKLVVSADLLLGPNTARITLASDSIQLRRFSDLGSVLTSDPKSGLPNLDLSGEVEIRADAEFSLSPFSLIHLNADSSWKNAWVGHNAIQVRPAGALDQGGEVIKIHLESEGSRIWHLSATPFSPPSPIPMVLSDLYLDVHMDESSTRITGRTTLGVKKSLPGFSGPVVIQKDTETSVHFSASISKTGEWRAEMSNKPRNKPATKNKSLHLNMNGVSLASEIPLAVISASGDGQKGAVQLEAGAENLVLESRGSNIRIPSFRITSDAVIDGGRWAAEFETTLPNTRLAAGNILGTIPLVSVSGEVKKSDLSPPQVNGHLELSGISLADTDSLLKIEKAGCSVPFKWPITGSGKNGNFTIKRVHVANRLFGTVGGTLRQENMGIRFKGTHDSKLLPGLKALFSGSILLQEDGGQTADLSFEIPALTLRSGVDLEQFIPGAEGVTMTGTLSAEGKIEAEDANLESTAVIRLDHGAIMMEEYNVSIEGIQTRVRMTDLIHLRSGPDQRIDFKNAGFGTLALTRGEIHFQIESPASFFIERSSFGWCNGNVDTQSLRILPDSDAYSLTLYCSRLDLAMMLSQLGDMTAEGKGTVNGKIPLEIQNGKIKILDGFLNSIPGNDGIIRLKGAETLTQRLLTGSPQFGQFELALEALKDYEYQWAKLDLNSEADILLMRLQFDGKPAKPLPFEFNPEQGGFARVEPGKAGSLFQGISLDVNLKLPLNDILRYKGVLNMVQ